VEEVGVSREQTEIFRPQRLQSIRRTTLSMLCPNYVILLQILGIPDEI
jgi:hypothetical protein